jgi:hypothetical protein
MDIFNITDNEGIFIINGGRDEKWKIDKYND